MLASLYHDLLVRGVKYLTCDFDESFTPIRHSPEAAESVTSLYLIFFSPTGFKNLNADCSSVAIFFGSGFILRLFLSQTE